MRINDFLKQIASDITMNNREYESDNFYYLLKYIGVKQNSSLVEDIELFYKDFLVNLDNSLVKYTKKVKNKGDNATHYIGFYVNKKADYKKAIKVYFPVKYEYMISALKTVFVYLVRNNIEAIVKFHVKATNEGIVIRFYNKEDVLPFINYCNNNFVLKELLLNTNPFIATIYGLGIVRDDNTEGTYNSVLSELLRDYFLLLKSNDALNQASELDFLDYVMKKANMEDNEARIFNIREIEKSIKSILNKTNPLD